MTFAILAAVVFLIQAATYLAWLCVAMLAMGSIVAVWDWIRK